MKRIISTAFLIVFFTSLAFAESNIKKGNAAKRPRLAICPELKVGGIDNGPAYVALEPLKMDWQLTNDIALKWGAGYVFEMERHNKPFGPLNHYGYRINGRAEWALFGGDIRLFYGSDLRFLGQF